MSMSLNRATLLGRVGKQPEIRSAGSGRVASFSLATSRKWKDKQTGEAKEVTQWHNIVVWGDALVGIVERFVNKGSELLVEGEIQTRKWTDQSGADKYTTEIVLQGFDAKLMLIGGKPAGDATETTRGGSYGTTPQTRPAQTDYGDEGDVPF